MQFRIFQTNVTSGLTGLTGVTKAFVYLSGSSGTQFTDRTAQLEKLKNGKFLYDNQALKIDADVDPRRRGHCPNDVTPTPLHNLGTALSTQAH